MPELYYKKGIYYISDTINGTRYRKSLHIKGEKIEKSTKERYYEYL